MGKVFFIVFLGLGFGAKAQVTPSTYQDTVNYLKNEIVAKKSLFVGKPLSVLLDSLKIKPVKLGIDWSPPVDSLKGRSAFLDFNYSTKFMQSHYLLIEWQNPLPWETYTPVTRQGYEALKTLYSPIIIKDIDIKDYNAPDPEDDLEY